MIGTSVSIFTYLAGMFFTGSGVVYYSLICLLQGASFLYAHFARAGVGNNASGIVR